MTSTVTITFTLTVENDSSVSNLTVIEENDDIEENGPESVVSDKLHSAVRNTIYQHNNSLPVRRPN